MNEYLGQQALARSLSPVRVAYVYPQGDEVAFRRAVLHASERWAGITEPIIPIDSSGTVTDADLQIVEISDVDALITIGIDPKRGHDAATSMGLDAVASIEEVLNGRAWYPMRTWEWRPLSHEPKVGARHDGDLWELVAAGSPSDDLPATTFTTEDHAGRAQFSSTTVLERNRAGLKEYWTRGVATGPVLLWVTDGNSLEDCAYYWNMRALRPEQFGDAPTFMLPRRAFADWVDLADLVRSVVAGRRYAGSPHVVIASWTVADADLRSIGESLGFTYEEVQTLTCKQVWGDERDPGEGPPYTFAVGIDPRNWVIFERALGYRASSQVQLFRTDTPVPVDVPSVLEAVEISPIAPLRLRYQAQFLDDLPRRVSVAHAVHPNGSWRRGEFTMFAGNAVGTEMRVSVPAASEVLACLTRDIGSSATPSDKGRLAAGLLSRDTKAFADVHALGAIRSLTTPRSLRLAKKLAEFGLAPDRHEAVIEWLASVGGRSTRRYGHIESIYVRGLNVELVGNALEDLARGGWVERGVEVLCPRCGIPSFLEFKDVPGVVTCPGCDAVADLAVDRGRVRVQYRLDSFLDRCSDQGVVAHVAVASALVEAQPFTGLHLGLDVKVEGAQQEVDLFGFVGRSVVAGEVKTSAVEFTRDQIDRDIVLSAALGASAHVVGCTEPLASDLIEAIRDKCAMQRMGVIIAAPEDGSRRLVADLSYAEVGPELGPRPW
ncbi:hypothetical protein ACVW00_003542 [Marmoricola sp. URHA0025 HA25]